MLPYSRCVPIKSCKTSDKLYQQLKKFKLSPVIFSKSFFFLPLFLIYKRHSYLPINMEQNLEIFGSFFFISYFFTISLYNIRTHSVSHQVLPFSFQNSPYVEVNFDICNNLVGSPIICIEFYLSMHQS